MTLVQRLALVTGATVCVGGGRRQRQRPRDAPIAWARGSRRSPSPTAPARTRSAIEPGASMVQTETAETDEHQKRWTPPRCPTCAWVPVPLASASTAIATPMSGRAVGLAADECFARPGVAQPTMPMATKASSALSGSKCRPGRRPCLCTAAILHASVCALHPATSTFRTNARTVASTTGFSSGHTPALGRRDPRGRRAHTCGVAQERASGAVRPHDRIPVLAGAEPARASATRHSPGSAVIGTA